MTRYGRKMGAVGLGAVALLLAVGLGAACDDGAAAGGAGGATASSTTGGDAGCANDPFACPAGKTCGFADVNGAKLECLPSGASVLGDACKNIVGAPECGDELICLQLQGDPGGTCRPFCDAAHPCAEGSCSPVNTAAGNVFHVCVSMTTSTSSSSSATSSSASSGSSSSSTGAGSSSSTGP